MSEQDKKALTQETTTESAKPEAAKDEKTEGTVGDALGTTQKSEEKKEEMVPLSALLEVKKDNKELAREMKELKKSIEQGASREEVSTDLAALAEKHNVDPDFLNDFAKAVRAETKRETEEEVTNKLKPVLEKDRAEKIDKAFNTHFNKALEGLPELKDVVNKDVIKTLSLAPENANKTFTQLIEEAYGHLNTGKRSIDSGTSRASKNAEVEIDHKRAATDPEYYKKIMANPAMKEEYNKGLVDRLSSRL